MTAFMKLSIGSRVAAMQPPILGQHIAPGTTGKVAEFLGCRAYRILFDGTREPVSCFPEDLVRISLDAPIVPLPRPKLAPRGRFANRNKE